MNSNPRSTVVIPVFNTGKILRETVESVLSQSGGKDEIVIVDDASTDDETLNTIASFRDNKNIKIVRHDRNRGLGASRNTGVANAAAEIIVPLDSDDLLSPSYFERMLKPFSDPDTAFTYCDVQCFGESNELWRSIPFAPGKIVEYQYICGCSPFRKQVHQAAGGYCEEDIFRRLNEDWDFWLGVCGRGFKGVYVPGGLYLYRRHKTNMTGVPRTFSLSVQQRMLERHRDFILQYTSARQFLAHGYEEAGYAYLQLNQTLDSLKYALRLLAIPGKRKRGIKLLLAAVKHCINGEWRMENGE